ncbi:hypothetical protein JR334_06085 [Clostridia bacterium]|nr:hypothetical protein JR334_06085 [Clostridia bacterium]
MNLFNKEEVLAVIKNWYDSFDSHAPIETYKSLLAQGELFIDLPPKPKTDFESFSTWYEENNKTFFDGKHTLKSIDISMEKETATAIIPLHWDVRMWTPGDAKSNELHLDMVTTITFVPDPETGAPRIQKYLSEE